MLGARQKGDTCGPGRMNPGARHRDARTPVRSRPAAMIGTTMDEPHDCRTACRELAQRVEDLEAEKAKLEERIERYEETLDEIANALAQWFTRPKDARKTPW